MFLERLMEKNESSGGTSQLHFLYNKSLKKISAWIICYTQITIFNIF